MQRIRSHQTFLPLCGFEFGRPRAGGVRPDSEC